MRWSPRGLQIEFQVQIHAQLELELCLQGQRGSKCSSRLCHTHTQCCLVWHEQLPLFAFWLHCEYIFVCCLNIKSACYIYNWSIYICTRQIRKVYLSPCVCVCVWQVCLCVCAYPVSWQPKIFLLLLPLLYIFPFWGCMLPHLGTINICTVPFCIGWANNMLHLPQPRPPLCAPSACLQLRLISKHGGQ